MLKASGSKCNRAVDSAGNTIDFLLSAKRDRRAAKRFFRQALKATHTQLPRVINVDKNPAYPTAIDELKTEELVTTSRGRRKLSYYLSNQSERRKEFATPSPKASKTGVNRTRTTATID